jgi:hypothetical protein
MERRSTHVTAPGQEGVTLPFKRRAGDWDVFIDMREVSLLGDPEVNLEYMAPDRFTDLRGHSGQPKTYTIVGWDLLLAPVPDKQYNVLLTYYSQIPPLGDEQLLNETILMYPDLYLYATLLESAPYARSSVPVELWAEYYKAARNEAQRTDRNARFGRQIAARAPRRY